MLLDEMVPPWAKYVTLLYGEDSQPFLNIHSLKMLNGDLQTQNTMSTYRSHTAGVIALPKRT